MPENIESKFMLWWQNIRYDVGLFSNLSLAQKAYRAGYEAAQQTLALDVCQYAENGEHDWHKSRINETCLNCGKRK